MWDLLLLLREKNGRRVSLFSSSSQPGLMHRWARLCLPPGMLYNGMGGRSPLLFANKLCLLQLLLGPCSRLKNSASLSSMLMLKSNFFFFFSRAKIMLLGALKSARGELLLWRKESRGICAGLATRGYTTALQRSSPSGEGQRENAEYA